MKKLPLVAAVLALGLAAPAFAAGTTDGPKQGKHAVAGAAKRVTPGQHKKLRKDLKKAKKRMHRLKRKAHKRGGR